MGHFIIRAEPERKFNLVRCEQCGWIWSPRVNEPSHCPLCKSTTWDKEPNEVTHYICKRCGYKFSVAPWWTPKICPYCEWKNNRERRDSRRLWKK